MFGSEHNVRVHSDREPEPLFRFRFDGLTEPNLEHWVRFGFEHCSECSEPDRGQSTCGTVLDNDSKCETY
jgi:hypothetical protein